MKTAHLRSWISTGALLLRHQRQEQQEDAYCTALHDCRDEKRNPAIIISLLVPHVASSRSTILQLQVPGHNGTQPEVRIEMCIPEPVPINEITSNDGTSTPAPEQVLKVHASTITFSQRARLRYNHCSQHT